MTGSAPRQTPKQALKPQQTYIVHQQGKHIGTGTDVEMAALTGLSPSTIRWYGSHAQQQQWQVTRVTEYVHKDHVDVERLKALIKEYGYTNREIAHHINATDNVIWRKLNRRSRWTMDELEVMEDLFFLDEGELLLGQDEVDEVDRIDKVDESWTHQEVTE